MQTQYYKEHKSEKHVATNELKHTQHNRHIQTDRPHTHAHTRAHKQRGADTEDSTQNKHAQTTPTTKQTNHATKTHHASAVSSVGRPNFVFFAASFTGAALTAQNISAPKFRKRRVYLQAMELRARKLAGKTASIHKCSSTRQTTPTRSSEQRSHFQRNDSFICAPGAFVGTHDKTSHQSFQPSRFWICKSKFSFARQNRSKYRISMQFVTVLPTYSARNPRNQIFQNQLSIP